MKQLLVTAALIEKKGAYLLTKRPEDERHNAGRWEFPGGKVEFGEDPRQCLEREITEELGIKVTARELFDYSSHVYDKQKHIVLLGIHCDYVSGDLQHKDIADHTWVAPEKMHEYDITEADLPFVKKLKE